MEALNQRGIEKSFKGSKSTKLIIEVVLISSLERGISIKKKSLPPFIRHLYVNKTMISSEILNICKHFSGFLYSFYHIINLNIFQSAIFHSLDGKTYSIAISSYILEPKRPCHVT